VSQVIGLGYSLHRKTTEGKQHEDRDVQFQHINETVEQFQQRQQPVISVDAKKGINRSGRGVEWQGENPFPSNNMILWTGMGKAIPYGVYDLMQNKGWVSVVRPWNCFLSGGDNSAVVVPDGAIRLSAGNGVINYCRLWWQQQLSQSLVEMGTATTGNWIRINHPGLPFPPGTSMQQDRTSFVLSNTTNWRARPLISRKWWWTYCQTRTGRKVRFNTLGIEITDEQLHSINLERDKLRWMELQNLSQSNSIVDQIILASLLTLPFCAAWLIDKAAHSWLPVMS